MQRVSLGVVLAGSVVLASACRTANPDGGEPVVLDGHDVAPPSVEPSQDITKIPPSLWSPAQRQSTASYYYLVAEYAAMKESAAKALPLFEAAYGLDPNPFLGGKMLAAKAQGGDSAEALLEARKMVLLYPKDAQLRYLYGDMLVRGGSLDDGAEQLEKCIELDPTYETAYLELTGVYNSQKQGPKALVVSKELVKNIPASILGWSQLSRLYLASGSYKEALIPARRAWEMQSGNPALTQIYALTLQLNGRTKQALAIYEQLYRLDPTDEELTSRMVDLYRELGNLEDAIKLLDAMAKEDKGTGRPVIQMQKALILWELKRFQEASDLLAKLSAEHPESDRLRYLNGVGYERLEKYDEALAAYRAVPDSSPFRYHADFRMVVVLKTQKKYDEALALARQMLDSRQAEWDSYGVVSGVYADAERYDEAIKVLDEGYAKFPDRPRLLFMKGVYQEKLGDRDGCIQTMRTVIQKDPGNSSAYNYLGYLFTEKGENLDEAEKLIKKALELKPDDGFYLDSLGWLEYQRGDYDKALPLLEKAAQIEPKEGVILEHVGDVHKVKGRLDEARSTYEKALKAGPLEPKDKERIEGKLKELKKD